MRNIYTKFANPPSMGDYTIRVGKIFDINKNFPEKGNFCLTLEQAKNAVTHFKPCNYNIEHKFSNMPAVTGQLDAILISKDEKELIGVHKLPTWYNKALDDMETYVSCEFSQPEKLLTGIAFTNNPAIEDAKVFNKDTGDKSMPDGFFNKLAAFFGNPDNIKELEKTIDNTTKFNKPAEEYVNKLIEDKKLKSIDKDAIISLVSRALEDDATSPIETFSRADNLKKQLESNKVEDKTGEKVPDTNFNTLNTQSTENIDLYNSVAESVKKGQI